MGQRILEWMTITSPGYLLNLGFKYASPALQVNSLPLSHQGSPRRERQCIKNSATTCIIENIYRAVVLGAYKNPGKY